MKFVEAKDLSLGYDSKTVVVDVNVQALKGEFICLLGPNGSGKSSILRCLAGLLAPRCGAVFIKGNSLYLMNPKDLSKTMGVVLTERPSPGLLTVFEVTAMGRYPYTNFFGNLTKEDERITWEALGMVNAHELAYRYFNELSDGEKQKVLIARALVQEPEVMILDEPTTYLDVRHRLEVMRILRRLTREKGITIIASLHDIDIALKSCDKVFLIKNGKIIASGPPEEVLNERLIEEIYDIEHAHFSSYLGGIEMKNSSETRVFVLGGGGSGTPVYRLLNKYGFGIITGVVHSNDIDYYVGKSLGALIIDEKPFEEIYSLKVEEAVMLARDASFIIDAGYPVGFLNRRNVELAKKLMLKGKTVYSLRQREEFEKLYGGVVNDPIYCPNIAALLDELKGWKRGKRGEGIWEE